MVRSRDAGLRFVLPGPEDGWPCRGSQRTVRYERWVLTLTLPGRSGLQDAVHVVDVPGLVVRDPLHDGAGVRGVDHVAAADVHGDVPLAVEDDQVARLHLGDGNVRQAVPLFVGGPRDGDARRRPGGLDQAGAVVGAGAGGAVHVGLAELSVGERDGLVRLGAGRPALGRLPPAAAAAATAATAAGGAADAVGLYLLLLRGGEAVERRLAAGEQLVQRGLLGRELRADLRNALLGALPLLADGGERLGGGEELGCLLVVRPLHLEDERRLGERSGRIARAEQAEDRRLVCVLVQ